MALGGGQLNRECCGTKNGRLEEGSSSECPVRAGGWYVCPVRAGGG